MTGDDARDQVRDETLVELLAKHRYRDVLGDYEIKPYRKHIGCSCGWQQDIGGMSGYWSWVAAQEAHLADVLAGYVATKEVDAAADALALAADRMPAFHDRDVPEWAITSACKWLRDRARAVREA